MDQYLPGWGKVVDMNDLVSVAEVAIEVIVGEILPNVLASVVGELPTGVLSLSSGIPVNVIEIKGHYIKGYIGH